MQPARIEDLFQYVSLSSLQGHDRGWCFTVQRVDEGADSTTTSIWEVDAHGHARERVAQGSGLACASDGSALAYLASAGDAQEVFVLDAASEQPRQVTDLGGGILTLEHFDPAQGRLLVRKTEPLDEGDADSPLAIEHVPCAQDGQGLCGRQAIRLGVIDLASGRYTACVDEGGDVSEARWAPDRSALAWVQRWSGRQRHGMDLWVRSEGQPARRLGSTLVSMSSLCWSPDGTRIALAATDVEGDSMTWLHVIDVRTGATRRFDIEMGMPALVQWADDGQRLLVSEARQGLQRITLVDLANGCQQTICEREAFDVQEIAARGHALAFTGSYPHDGPEVWIAGALGESPRKVTSFNDWRRQRRAVKAERRRFPVPDGEGGQEEIDGWLLLPDGKGPFPLLLDMRGGPQTPASLGYERHPYWPVLLERGWAILALNAVGASSYGADFAQRLRGHWGELDYPQWQAAVAQLQADGLVGREVAAFGHSYGGYLAAWALGQDPSLLCGVVSGAVINLESHAGDSDTGYYVSPYAMEGELTDRRSRYRRLSPITYAHQTAAPVLILQGVDDRRCPLGQAHELFSTLLRHTRVPVRLIRFPGGSHHVSTTGKPSHRVAYFNALVDWVEQWRANGQGERLLAAPDATSSRQSRVSA